MVAGMECMIPARCGALAAAAEVLDGVLDSLDVALDPLEEAGTGVGQDGFLRREIFDL